MEHPLGQVEAGHFRLGHAADGAGVHQGLIPRQAHEAQLVGSLYQGQGLVELIQGVQGVEDQRQGCRVGPPLHRHGLHHLCEVGGQAQLHHVGLHVPELLEGFRLVEGEVVPVLEQGHVRVDQQLGRGRQRAPLPAAAPGLDGAPAPLGGEDGENLVRLFVVDLPEHQPLGADVRAAHSSR